MKNTIKLGLGLAMTFITMTSFAFQTCTIGSADFCKCFVSNCKQTLPANACFPSNIKKLIRSQGVQTVCRVQQPNNVAQCVAAANAYIASNSICH